MTQHSTIALIAEPLPHERAAGRTPLSLGGELRWPTWNAAVALLVAVLIVRLAYLIWLSPFELVGDEAYYWEQSRHLDLCYNEKGPALPWMITGCCRLFGDNEAAVRLPVALSSLLAGWGVGRLAMGVAATAARRDRERVGFCAVAIFCLLPAFQANAQLCTQDGPLIAIWVALTAIGLSLFRRWRERANAWPQWLLMWFVLGVGFLFKQSILLFLPGIAIFWLIERRRLRIGATTIAQQVVGVAVFLLVVSPIIWWNAHHGWPLLAHTAGHLGAGGDQEGLVNHGNALSWLGITIGGIIGSFGPAAVLLMLWGTRDVVRGQAISDREVADARRDRIWLLCAAWPSVVFFIALSFIKPVVASWPLPGMVPLVVIVAELAARELPRYHQRVMAWREKRRTDRTPAGKKPDTFFHQMWAVLLGYGVGGWIVFSFPNALTHLPIVGPRAEKSLMKRISGHRAVADEVAQARAAMTTADGAPPLIVTPYYMDASLLAFYLPDHPPVFTAGKYLGKRSTTFDQWPDTNLENPALRGQSLLLVAGKHDVAWERGLIFSNPRPVGAGILLAQNYRGPRGRE